jgi:hypothetical protein
MLENVTPGPWAKEFSDYGDEVYFGGDDCGMWSVGTDTVTIYLGGNGDRPGGKAIDAANANFIAWAREAVPALAAERDRAIEDAIYNAQYVDLVSKYRAERDTLAARAEAAEADIDMLRSCAKEEMEMREAAEAKLAERDADVARLREAATEHLQALKNYFARMGSETDGPLVAEKSIYAEQRLIAALQETPRAQLSGFISEGIIQLSRSSGSCAESTLPDRLEKTSALNARRPVQVDP